MPAPFDTETLGNGNPLFRTDGAGNIFLPGTANIGTAIALSANSKAPVQVPGQLTLWTPDGQSLSMIAPSGAVTPVSLGPVFAPVVVTAPATVTGVSAITALGTGITVPAGSLAAGQLYRVVAWGALTTTLAAQTVKFQLNYGSAGAGVDLLDFGAQQPNSGGTVTGGAWRCEWDVEITGTTTASTGGFNGPNFSPTTINQNLATGLSTAAQPLTVCVTPSATAVSVTMNGLYCHRIV